MLDPIDVNCRNWNERATIHARDTTGDYMRDRFRAGEDALHAIEAAELGDISGKRVLHLQWHIGATRSARCGSAPWPPNSISRTQCLTSRDGSPTKPGWRPEFVEGTVDEAPRLTSGPFDLVFTTWGDYLLGLPDIKVWATVTASVLASGGELYFAAESGATCKKIDEFSLVSR